jgi:putative membrane protein
MSLLLRLFINAAALYAATRFVDGISFSGTPVALLGVALVFAIVNTMIKPIVAFFSLPAIILTLGLFLLVINAGMLMLTSALSRTLGLGFSVRGFGAALLGSIVVSLTSLVLGAFLASDQKKKS